MSEKQTVIIFEEGEDLCEISTSNRKWINRMVKLVGEGHAEEVEPTIDGNRDFEFDKSLLKMPFFRRPRSYTEEQKEEARERLARVREEVAKGRKKKAKPAAKKKGKPGRKPKPKPVEIEEDYEDEIEDEDEEEEEVVVKRPRKRRKK